MKEAIHASTAPQPAGPYSHAVRTDGLIFLAGQGPANPESGAISGTFEQQVRQTLTNLAAVATAAGASLADAVSVRVYLRDMANFEAMNAVYEEFFAEPYPARTTTQSNMTIDVEIDAVLAVES